MVSQTTRNRINVGFTLIELLVVISIVTLLISILLPALGKARSAAVTMQCSSFQRQAMQGFYIYAQGNKGMFPAMGNIGNSSGSGTDPATSGIWGSWIGRLMASGSIPYHVKDTNKRSSPSAAANIYTGLLGCPATPLASSSSSVISVTGYPSNPYENIGSTYGLNWQMWRTSYPTKIVGTAGSHYTFINPDLIPRPSSTITIGDQTWKGSASNNFRLQRTGAKVSDSNLVNNNETVDFRHGVTFQYGNTAGTVQYVNYNGSANMSYFDGHVKAQNDNDIKTNGHAMWTGGL